MIIFINGAFGVGKTTVAHLLAACHPNSLLFDPEEVGFFLRNVVRPIETFDDFQDLPMWRSLTVTTARMLRETYGHTLIMPMTIWHEQYFDEIMNGLREFEPRMLHFCLTARAETIRQRLLQRVASPQVLAWTMERVNLCVSAFQSPKFAFQIETDDMSPNNVVESILPLWNK